MKQTILYLIAVFSKNLHAQGQAVHVASQEDDNSIWNTPWIYFAIVFVLIFVLKIIGIIINRKDF